MQFYLVQRPQDYFTFLSKVTPARALLGDTSFNFTTPHIHQGMAWAGYNRSATSRLANVATHTTTPLKLPTSRQRLVAFVLGTMTLGIAVPLISQVSHGIDHQKLNAPISTTNIATVNNTTNNTTAITSPTTTAIHPNAQGIATNTTQKILVQNMLTLAVIDNDGKEASTEKNNATDNRTNNVTSSETSSDTSTAIDPRFIQDYGQAIAQQYANRLGVTLSVTHYATLAQAQHAVAAGKADILMTPQANFSAAIPTASLTAYHAKDNPPVTMAVADTNLATINVSCQSYGNGKQEGLAWQIKSSEDKFPHQVQDFLCNYKAQHATLWDFYTQNSLQHRFNQAHFSEAVTQTLPRLKPIFQQNAQVYHHDWKMLAAVGYQESHLRSNAVSPTGVRGIMMLTNDTAKAMNISNRTDPNQSIKGGAKYLEILQNQFLDVPASDRLWFTLAAYNMGPMAILGIQEKLRQSGKDVNSWAEVYHYMMINKKYMPRYVQCMDYVSNIHGYLTLLNQASPATTPPATQTV